LIPLAKKIDGEDIKEISNTMKHKPDPHKKLTPPSTQNLGIGFVGLLSYMLLNFLVSTQCGTRLILKYLTLYRHSKKIFIERMCITIEQL